MTKHPLAARNPASPPPGARRWVLRRLVHAGGGGGAEFASTLNLGPRQAGDSEGEEWAGPSRQVRVLLIPADPYQECGVQVVAADGEEVDHRAADLLIGGNAQATNRWRLYGLDRGHAPGSCRLYLDGDRVTRGLPTNHRAATLGARLGNIERDMRLHGPVLVVGMDLSRDVDVPDTVVSAAWRSGLLVNAEYSPEPGREPPNE